MKLGGISVITDDYSYVILNFFQHRGSFILFSLVKLTEAIKQQRRED